MLLSGIGPYNHSKNLGIPLVHNLNVGHEMKDEPCIALFADSKPQKRQPDAPQVTGITDDFKIIIEALILPLTSNTTRIPIAAKLAFPASKGKLELVNKDPRQNPSVKFNYLAKEEDAEDCAKMVQLLERVARSESIALFLGMERKNNHMLSGQEEARRFCKENVRTFYHYHGGCTVGSVVDKDYRVFGVQGLRVVDGSTFSESPGTNPMATLLMLGRYQGIKILEERKK